MVKMQIHDGGRCDFTDILRGMEVRTGVEVGVLNGENAAVLCRCIPTLERLYCVDPYQTDVDGYTDAANNSQRIQDCRANLVQSMVDTGDIRGILIRQTSQIAAETLKKYAPFDFVYIDANHKLDHIRKDLALWTPLVRIGGLVAGHDFGLNYLDSVVPAVFELVDSRSVHLHVFKNDDIWCFFK